MAKFCENCGKELKKGEICNCKNKNKEKEVKEVIEEKVNDNEILKDGLDILKNIFKSPLDTMAKYEKKSKFNLGIILIVINSIIFGLCGYLIVKEVYGLVYSAFSLFMESSDVPFKVFAILTILMLAYHFVIGGLLHLISKDICKSESDLKKTYMLVGTSSVITSITNIIALICMYISTTLGFIILIISFIFYLLTIYQGFTKLSKVNENKEGYVFTSAFVIAAFVAFYIIPKILL